METCSILDFFGCFHQWFWWLQYWPWFFYTVIGLGFIWLLAKIKEVAGVQGELGFIGLIAFLGGIIFDRTKLQGKAVIPSKVPTKSVSKPKKNNNDLPPPSLTESNF